MCPPSRRILEINVNRTAPPDDEGPTNGEDEDEDTYASVLMKFLFVTYVAFALFSLFVAFKFFFGPCNAETLYISLTPTESTDHLLVFIFYSYLWISVPNTVADVLFHFWYFCKQRPTRSDRWTATKFHFVNGVFIFYAYAVFLIVNMIVIFEVQPLLRCVDDLFHVLAFFFTRLLSFLMISVYLGIL